MTNLILCGGAGTRLWPLSRQSLPKQFYPLFEGRTLFEEAVLRNKDLVERFWVASNESQMALAREQMEGCGVSSFGSLVEPVGRNTAPAIALVCQQLPPNELVFVTPSDHRITKPTEYRRAVERARVLAEQGFLVTFGIRPSYPETGYGYIEANGETVVSFREKPESDLAKAYVESGKYLWNSGMFAFRAGVFLEELKRHSPEVFSACALIKDSKPSLDAMMKVPSMSIDYAVMEKSDRVKVVAFDPGWSDLGSFDALFDEIALKDESTSVLGTQSPVILNAKRNMIVGDSRKVALVDVDDLIVIDTPDALLIMKRGSSQKVKDIVSELKKDKSTLLD